MSYHDDYRAALALRHTPHLGPRTWKKLALAYPTLTEAAKNAAAWPSRKLAPKRVADAFRDRAWARNAEREYRDAQEMELKAVLLGQPEYPPLLEAVPDPPLLLYFRGRLSLSLGPAVAMVGTRRATEYGLELTQSFAAAFSAAGVTVVSGLAMGIDRAAHQGALDGPGSTVAVLGSGLGKVSPPINHGLCEDIAAKGLVLSEFPPQAPPDTHTFPLRNRIISGLSLATLVTEAGCKSGALITARHALEQNREVFAMPGEVTRPSFDGCHGLIAQGAGVAVSPHIVLRAVLPQLKATEPPAAQKPPTPSPAPAKQPPPKPEPAAPPPPASEEEAKLLAILDAGGKVHIDALGRAAKMDGATVSRLLLGLELSGRVRKWPGMFYSLMS